MVWMSSTINIIINNSKKMTNYSFKMGTFSFRFLKNKFSVNYSYPSASRAYVRRSSQNDLTGSPISSGQAELESIKSLNSWDSSREKEKNLPEAGKFSSLYNTHTYYLGSSTILPYSVNIRCDGLPLSGVVFEHFLVIVVLVLGPGGHDDEASLGEHVGAEPPRHTSEAKPTQRL